MSENRPYVKDGDIVIVPSTKIMKEKNNTLTRQDLLDWHHTIIEDYVQTWADFSSQRFAYHIINKSPPFYKCSCPVGYKKDACVHSVCLMVADGLYQYPVEVTSQPIQYAKRRGRPLKATPALQRD
uniref:SWIM-type domain-containing protein n=1 Tax=Acrobeloides nanus TaxID=290746 RepID=A0A914DI05_9BILA